MDADWRREDWVLNDPQRSRIVRVMGDGHLWITLAREPTQQILAFYDCASMHQMLRNVQVNAERCYDYRFEGGCQWPFIATTCRVRTLRVRM